MPREATKPRTLYVKSEGFYDNGARCPYCVTPVARLIGKHLVRCASASDEERAFYSKHRAWPSGPSLDAEPGLTVPERLADMAARLQQIEEVLGELLMERGRRRKQTRRT